MEQSNSLMQLFLKHLEEMLIFFEEEELWMLTFRFLFSFALCSLICSVQRSFVYNVHKEQRGRRSRGHKILANFANGCAQLFGKFFFLLLWTSTCTISKSLSVICKDLLHLLGCLVLPCFLEVQLQKQKRCKGLS